MTELPEQDPPASSSTRRAAAWMVHWFTACGVVCCLLALEATFDGNWRTALLWLVAAVAIDAVDGTLARLVNVRQVVPQFDGALLDNIIDYLSYAFIPALIIHHAGLLPEHVSFVVACAICLASAYQFCQDDAKTPDHYFKGFPSYWNIAALYLLALQLSPVVNLVVLLTLIVLVFVPVKYIYVTRTQSLKQLTWPLTILWSMTVCVILWQLPDPAPVLVWSSLIYVVYYTTASVYLTLQR